MIHPSQTRWEFCHTHEDICAARSNHRWLLVSVYYAHIISFRCSHCSATNYRTLLRCGGGDEEVWGLTARWWRCAAGAGLGWGTGESWCRTPWSWPCWCCPRPRPPPPARTEPGWNGTGNTDRMFCPRGNTLKTTVCAAPDWISLDQRPNIEKQMIPLDKNSSLCCSQVIVSVSSFLQTRDE